ncbi:hypothetical protein AVEN_222471-1 [Araneus ventricosus]|uniref:Uncharacterized protein n=1 Tax=Araneus ventricosus TaxID=182803 RepID=A0A4Y2AYH1_ARAVE|nr:hypothetical protein AVEN_222471-1 [Araneus ventricosus]
MTRTTPELAPPSPNFRATPTGGRLATTYDLACNRPHTRRIFSGIGFRTCDPPVPSTEPELTRQGGDHWFRANRLETALTHQSRDDWVLQRGKC